MGSSLQAVIRLLITPHYQYPDQWDQLRARVTLLVCAVGAVACGLLLLLPPVFATLGQTIPNFATGTFIAFCFYILTILLIHSGRLRIAMWLLYALLTALSVQVALHGADTVLLLVMAVTVIYGGVMARAPGALVTLGIQISLLVFAAVLQANGSVIDLQLSVPERAPVAAGIGIAALTVIGVIAAAFAQEVHLAFSYSMNLLRQLRSVLDVGQVTATLTTADEILTRTVSYVRDRFAIYHVQIFLVDKERRVATLAASTGDAGKALMDSRYRVPLSASGVISRTVMSGEPVIAVMGEERVDPSLEVTMHFARSTHELLPHTKSELALPLVVGDQIIGALDLHSTRVNAFAMREIDSYRLLANQIALSIHNVKQFEEQQAILDETRRMYFEAETTLRESQQINQRLTAQAWRDYVRSRMVGTIGYTLFENRLRPDSSWTSSMEHTFASRRAQTKLIGTRQVVTVPIELRGQVIGAIEVDLDGDSSQTDAQEITQAVAHRLALSIDNARLFEQTQELAQQEFELNSISSKIQGVIDVQELIKVTIHELSVAIDADRASIRLGRLADKQEDRA